MGELSVLITSELASTINVAVTDYIINFMLDLYCGETMASQRGQYYETQYFHGQNLIIAWVKSF